MKKIDLHIHTVPTVSDSHFVFSLDTFRRYVSDSRLDAVAITNHNVFDAKQYLEIKDALPVPVFPGIEINLGKGHLLVITGPHDVDDFHTKSLAVTSRVKEAVDSISFDEFVEIYKDLGKYLLIPHYEKSPSISGDLLEQLKPYVCAGEVDSAKKFVRVIKDKAKLTPVLFSDSRMREGLSSLPIRQTFIDCGELTLSALKATLLDRSKVALSEGDGNTLWQVFSNGQHLSTGLNVLMGSRSSGKTHTLNAIEGLGESTKYIRQFSLVQHDDAKGEQEFKSDVERKRSLFVDAYLQGFKRVLEDVVKIDVAANEKAVEVYVETLLKSAADADRQDAFSKALLFNEVDFPVGNTNTLVALISSVRQVIENVAYRSIIEKHVSLESLKLLAVELIETLWTTTLDHEKMAFVNSISREIKQGLKVRTSAIQVEDVDLYGSVLDTKRVERFCEIVTALKGEAVIFEETLQGFKVEAKREPFRNASEVKSVSAKKTSFVDAFKKYGRPHEYLRELLANAELPRADLYKLFAKVTYRILNADGFEVSGGERSEFRLLHEISDAQNYDILLVDEPESSFDNLFLHGNVNEILKSISQLMPVVVVTHNNTVGASVGADYLLYARKEFEAGEPVYRIYSGFPTDKILKSPDGKEIKCHETLMNSLEAGHETYEKRRRSYEALKN